MLEEVGQQRKDIRLSMIKISSKHKGFLKHNSQGRYAFEDGYYFTNEDRESIHNLSGIEAKLID